MDIRLFICGKEVELTDEVSFAITREFEDLSDPTTIINDWSKTVEIPFSDANNRLFGGIFSPNRAIAENDGTHANVGLYFDPTQKLDFVLLWNGVLLMNGYARMDSIKHTDGHGVYCITLNGELGRLFQMMQKLGFYDENDENYQEEEAEYDLTNEITGVINKDVVYECWNNANYQKTHDIGWACCNDGYNKDFKSDTVQISDNKDQTFVSLLEGQYAIKGHNVTVSPDTLVGDGLLPRSFGEYRSYYQRPYIYIPSMFSILKKRFEGLDGNEYKLVLHPKWFNSSNLYYSKMVMMLNKVSDIEDSNKYENTYGGYPSSFFNKSYYRFQIGDGTTTFTPDTSYYSIFATINSKTSEEKKSFNGTSFTVSGESYVDLLLSDIQFGFCCTGNTYSYDDVKMYEDVGVVFKVYAYGTSGTVREYKAIVVSDDTTLDTSDYDGVYTASQFDIPLYSSFQNYCVGTFTLNNFHLLCPSAEFDDTIQIRYSFDVVNDNKRSSIFRYKDSGQWYPVHWPTYITTPYAMNYASYTDTNVKMTLYDVWNRSYAKYKFRDLWDTEKGFFEEILKYCKLFRLTFVVDEEKKTLTILPMEEYFRDYSITNYDEKLDYSQDFSITPCVMDTKYLSLGYDDNETKIGVDYLSNYGVNFGDSKLNTNYNFNEDTTKLLEGIPASITNTSVGVDWDNLYTALENSDIKHFQNFETKPYFEDDDHSSTDAFGTFYFYNGTRSFDSKIREVHITDDTDYQLVNDVFMYIDPNAESAITNDCMIATTKYPWLDIVDRIGNLCVFNKPVISYDANNSYANTKSIYYNFWKGYLDERYNLQNNKIECNLDITPVDYINFKFNDFIYLNDRLYIINKISDYDVSSKETTKCELVSVYDLEGYTKQNYQIETYLILSTSAITKQGTVTIYSDNGVLPNYDTSKLSVTITHKKNDEYLAIISPIGILTSPMVVVFSNLDDTASATLLVKVNIE